MAREHAVKSALRDRPAFFADVANHERFALIAVPAVDDRRQVDVDDVAFLQHVVIRECRGR